VVVAVLDAASASSSDTASGPAAAALCLPISPSGDLRSEPEFDPTRPQIDGRLRHVVVAPLVLAHGVAMGEVKDVGDTLRVDEIVDRDSLRHNN